MVYRHVARARGSIAELKRTAETRFDTLVERSPGLFFELHEWGRYPPDFPFYLAIDEVEAPNLLSGRRPGYSRFGVIVAIHSLEFDFIGCTWPLRLPGPASVNDTARAACSPETQPPSVVLSCSALLPTSWATIPHRSLPFPADGHLKTHAPTQTITISNRPVLRLHRSPSSWIRRCWGAFFAQTISMICPYRSHIVRSVPSLASCDPVNQLADFFRFCSRTK
ncbi:uncharacterized protein STEHIDRAFT_119487, partial [Stereum hirsutum FP-91666 SS1]|uniref:uncharacterized protein n=1 Tax=Stereum hirsutum (strain FP-91666) TaxID=721885 RepID=UPI00044106E2